VLGIEDVVIIGAGPAGLAAALQLRRYAIAPRLFERGRPGGLLWNAYWVENYFGFAGGISGPKLARAFDAQAASASVRVTEEDVVELTWKDGFFRATTPAGVYKARTAVIASGTKPRTLTDFPIPDACHERVVYEIVPLLSLAGKRMIIVGAGDAAFDYALNLSKENDVIIINRGEQVKCLPLLWERASTCPHITYRPRTAISRLAATGAGGLTVECSSPGGTAVLQADYLIGAIGRDPQLDFVSASLLEQSSELENRGILHFVGDVKNGMYRQTAIAVGDGIRAGMRIYQVLKESTDESDCLDR